MQSMMVSEANCKREGILHFKRYKTKANFFNVIIIVFVLHENK